MNHFYTNYFDRDDTPAEEIQEQTFYNDTSLNLRAEYQKLINNKTLIKKFGENSRLLVEKNFSDQKISSDFQIFFKKQMLK